MIKTSHLIKGGWEGKFLEHVVDKTNECRMIREKLRGTLTEDEWYYSLRIPFEQHSIPFNTIRRVFCQFDTIR